MDDREKNEDLKQNEDEEQNDLESNDYDLEKVGDTRENNLGFETVEKNTDDDFNIETQDDSEAYEELRKKINYNVRTEYNNDDYYYRYNSRRKKKKRGVTPFIITALISALIGGIISSYIAPNYLYGKLIPMPEIYKYEAKDNTPKIEIKPSDIVSSVTAVAKKSMKSVVGITTVEIRRDWFYRQVETQGVGSGVIVNENGYILTNSHVIGDGRAEEITIQFEDGTKEIGVVLWYEPMLDLAIVKVESNNLPSVELGDSDKIEVGELAVAIGNPLGLQFQRTVTSGIISGLNRTISDESMELDNLIQTDASINPGNSGGPLLNSKGEVIGINTAKITSAEGLGFSIPINVVKPIIDQVIKEGSIKPVYIGFRGVSVDKYEKGLGIDLAVDKGIVVYEVFEDSPAVRANLQPMDIIISIDQIEVNDMIALRKILYNYRPGQKATLKILRNGKEINLVVEFAETPSTF